MSVKALLAILSLPLLLVLSSCGDSDPTRGISKGTQVIYRHIDIIGHDTVYGKPHPRFDHSRWLADKDDNTVTVRTPNGWEFVHAKSEVVWMKEAKDPKPMPKKAEPEE